VNTHTMQTVDTDQVGSHFAVVPRERLEVRVLAQGHLSHSLSALRNKPAATFGII